MDWDEWHNILSSTVSLSLQNLVKMLLILQRLSPSYIGLTDIPHLKKQKTKTKTKQKTKQFHLLIPNYFFHWI